MPQRPANEKKKKAKKKKQKKQKKQKKKKKEENEKRKTRPFDYCREPLWGFKLLFLARLTTVAAFIF